MVQSQPSMVQSQQNEKMCLKGTQLISKCSIITGRWQTPFYNIGNMVILLSNQGDNAHSIRILIVIAHRISGYLYYITFF